jgi:hypothetical protein
MGVKAKIPHFALERVKLMVEAGQFMIQQGRARVSSVAHFRRLVPEAHR